MSDLVRELRELAKVWTAAFHARADILTEAADEIERLQAVVDAARRCCVEFIDSYGHTHIDSGKYEAAHEILRALDGEP